MSSVNYVLERAGALIQGLGSPASMTELLRYPLNKAAAHLQSNRHWPVIELPLLLGTEFALSPRVSTDLAIANLLLYGFADITDDAQDGDLPEQISWQRAVNAGNLLSFLGSKVLLGMPLEASLINRLASAYAAAGQLMTHGQELDLLATYPHVPTIEAYFDAIAKKSGASAAFFAQAAAIAAGHSEHCVQDLGDFGRSLGAYIQILSDLEGYDGNVSSDFKNLKVTLPLLFGLASSEGETIRAHLEQGSAGDLAEALRRLGAPAYCRMRAELLRRRANKALSRVPISGPTRAALMDYLESASKPASLYL